MQDDRILCSIRASAIEKCEKARFLPFSPPSPPFTVMRPFYFRTLVHQNEILHNANARKGVCHASAQWRTAVCAKQIAKCDFQSNVIENNQMLSMFDTIIAANAPHTGAHATALAQWHCYVCSQITSNFLYANKICSCAFRIALSVAGDASDAAKNISMKIECNTPIVICTIPISCKLFA